MRELAPDVIVNAAAYTAVDRAEDEPDVANHINGVAPGVLAGEASRLNALLIHYSTDYVFDGSSDRPYAEDDATGPLSAYGRSKLQGEAAIAGSGAQALIFRTAWVYAARGRNFLRTIDRLAREREELAVVDDQRGAPTWARLDRRGHCGGRSQASRRQARKQFFGAQPCRIYHLTCAGETTWYGFASEIVTHMRQRGPGPLARLRPISTAEYPTKAVRPRYSVLSNARLQHDLGIALPDWKEALDLCLSE